MVHGYVVTHDEKEYKNIYQCTTCAREVHIFCGDVIPKRVEVVRGDKEAGHIGGHGIAVEVEVNADTGLWKGLFNPNG